MQKPVLCLILVLSASAVCESKAAESKLTPPQLTAKTQSRKCADQATKALVLQLADKDVKQKFGPDPAATYIHAIENIRVAGTDKETGEVFCKADLIRSPTSSSGKRYRDQVFPIRYSSEMTTEGNQYVTVFGLNARPSSR